MAQVYNHNEKEKDIYDSDDVQVVPGHHGLDDMETGHVVEGAQAEHVEATKEEMLEAAEKIDTMPLSRAKAILRQVRQMHQHDQNFPVATLEQINKFLDDPELNEHDKRYTDLINAMKLEALLVTENSPYAEVRAVVEPTDDTTLPIMTFRMWFIGIILAGAGAFVNQLFSIRQPSVYITSSVAQLVALPFGRLLEKILPKGPLNPGPFNKKEHMLITIMANVAFNTPYTGYIVFTQAMPFWFNQPYAKKFGYQILNTLGSNFVGYGLAGIVRRFIVWPAFCVWPASLSTLAINKAFHYDDESAVPGPFGRIYTMSRMKVFTLSLTAMFVYWWFPGFIFDALRAFNWLSWISPTNKNLTWITGFNNGLGVNPWPTFDFNVPSWNGWTPMVIPWFSVWNQFFGMVVAGFMIIGWYWTNAFNSAYLPINSNKTFANDGTLYNVSLVLDDKAQLDPAKYQQYSEPYMAAGNLVNYFWFFAAYAATVSYTILYHRHEVVLGFKGAWRVVRKQFRKKASAGDAAAEEEEELAEDIHWRLMQRYKEVPEWWYLIILCLALAVGMVGVGVYPTNTTPAVVIYGIIMALIFVVPIGLITAVTGVQVTLNVLAEFIGGALSHGDALEMNYFKMYGYITTAQALFFSNDLKLAHYSKIPPRYTFIAQLVATLVSTFITTAIFNFQMSFKDVCTDSASFGMSCPGDNTFFTAAVFWGTVGPRRLFGSGGRYRALMAGFPVGFVLPFIGFGLTKMFPRVAILRQFHPVMFCMGGLLWAPYNLSYMWPMVMLTYVSWVVIKKRHLAFWAKYNYIVASAWSAAIAIAAIIIFFGLQIPDVAIEWWGNDNNKGCERKACRRLPIPEKGYFGGDPGTFL